MVEIGSVIVEIFFFIFNVVVGGGGAVVVVNVAFVDPRGLAL